MGGFENTVVGPFLATLSSQAQMLNRIDLRFGDMSVDILKTPIVQFKQLRSPTLIHAVLMSDFVLSEVLGTLPSLGDLTLSIRLLLSSRRAPHCEFKRSKWGSQKNYSLENIIVTSSFFLIQHLLGSIDSPYLKSIEVYPDNDNELDSEHFFIPFHVNSHFQVVWLWSQSLKKLVIGPSLRAPRNTISKCLMLFTVLHEMQTFRLFCWRMENVENMDGDVRCLVMSWPLAKVKIFESSSRSNIYLPVNFLWG